jgi:hypothetical protein
MTCYELINKEKIKQTEEKREGEVILVREKRVVA